MTTEPVEKLVCQLAVPTIIIMMVSALYNMADTYFVGSLGTSATAAVGISFSFMAIIQAVGFFFGQGTGNYISRALGAQNSRDAEKMAATGFFTAFIIGALLTVAGTRFLTPLIRSLGATDTILPYARDYLRFILLGAPFMISSLMLNNLLRFQGSAFTGMIGMISGAALNIILDPLFIFVFHMGVMGASLATMISQTVSCTLLFIIGCTGKNNVRILPRNFSPRGRTYREIVRGGLPSLLRQGLMGLATILLNHAAGRYGDAVIAAMSIVNRVFLVAGSALLGFGQGFQPVCGFNYGAKLYGRVKQAFWFCLRLSIVALVILGIICFIFAPDIIAFFRKDDPVVIKTGALALRFQCFTFPLAGWIILNNMMLQTMGKAVPAGILAFARQGLFLIPLLFTLVPSLGVLGIQLCIPIADLCTFILALPLGISVLRKDLGSENPAAPRST
ncbi:MAG: MATE family efflux transporter [Treponema sp.]|jgi:putative MATE family efflux protein|nr:MATE family efflux transporter [Treponema sp.]